MNKKTFLLIGVLLIVLSGIGATVSYFFSKGTLTIEAQLIYKLSGPQPVGRQYFYLLDRDPSLPPKDDAKFQAAVDGLKSETDKQTMLTAGVLFQMVYQFRDKAVNTDQAKTLINTLAQTKIAWQMHQVAETQTDFKGIGQFQPVKPGRYWVLGETPTIEGVTIWSLPVDIKRGSNKLLLDQGNAIISK